MISRRLRSIGALLIASTIAATAQQESDSTGDVALRGRIVLEHDLYQLSADPGDVIAARRPPSLLRLIFNPVVSVGGISIPFDLMLTVPESATRGGAGESLADFVTNPANSIGIAPSMDWATLSLGSHSPRLSALSGGDVTLFGVGTELSPGAFRLVASAGSIGQPGGFARHALMGRVAYAPDGGQIGINLVRVRDDAGSLSEPGPAMPAESFTATLDASATIGPVVARGEFAGSLFTRNMLASKIDGAPDELNALVRQRLSSRADIAGTLSLGIERDEWGATLSGEYIGAGYRTLAYPWMESDRLDVTLASRATLLDNALDLAGTIGFRRNDLSQTEGAQTAQVLGSLDANIRAGDLLSVNAQYANYGLRNRFENDTLRVETVSHTASVSPTLTLATAPITHVLSASAAINDYIDHNLITGRDASNHTVSLSASYSGALTELPLDFSLCASTMTNALAIGDVTTSSGSIGLGTRLFGELLRLDVAALLSRSALGAETPDEGVGVELRAAWRATASLDVTARGSITDYTYGGARTGSTFVERFLRTSLEWRF